MKSLTRMLRTSTLVVVLIILVGVFAYAALRSGPLAPIQVVAATVENLPISPGLFGIGTLDARYTYRIGPTFAGRIRRVDVHVGNTVKAGDLLGEMDPVDLEARIQAQEAALARADANISAARAQVQDIQATAAYARNQARRYEQLFLEQVATEELVEAKRQERQVADARLLAAKANLNAVLNEQVSVRAGLEGLILQRANLRLVAPVDGLVTARSADPGTTVVAGQPDYLVAGRHITRSHYEAVSDVATGFKPGDRIRIRRNLYTVVGLTRRMVSSGGDPMVFIPLKDAQEAQFLKDNDAVVQQRRRTAANPAFARLSVPGILDAVIALQNTNPYVNAVLVQLKPGYDHDRVADTIRRWKRLQVFTRIEMEKILVGKLVATSARQIGMFLVILSVVSAAIVAFIIYTLTLGKIREIAVLKWSA